MDARPMCRDVVGDKMPMGRVKMTGRVAMRAGVWVDVRVTVAMMVRRGVTMSRHVRPKMVRMRVMMSVVVNVAMSRAERMEAATMMAQRPTVKTPPQMMRPVMPSDDAVKMAGMATMDRVPLAPRSLCHITSRQTASGTR